MSLSQKYPGKILVPWFNGAEWKYVSNLILSNNKDDYMKALELLQLWKIRTPVLASGIEGTIIILEALLSSDKTQSDEVLTKIYALALMRFLNICAANSDKQGGFNKMLTGSDLPKWLIDIRHEIAHDTNLPSKPVLEMSLDYCFLWLVQNYWMVQSAMMKEHMATECENIVTIFKLYIQLKQRIYKNAKPIVDNDFIREIAGNVPKRLNKKTMDISKIVEYWEEVLTKSLTDRDDVVESFVDVLVTADLKKNEEQEVLCNDFRDIWKVLFNIFHDKGLLFNVLNTLHNTTLDAIVSDKKRKVASLWIYEIVRSLAKSKRVKEQANLLIGENGELDPKTTKMVLKMVIGKYPEFNATLDIDSSRIPCEDALKFEERILEAPNKYTSTFLEILLKFNSRTDDCIKAILNLLESLNTSNSPRGSQHVYEVNKLSYLIEQCNTTSDHKMNGQHFHSSRWKSVSNPEDFLGLPLGILPTQTRLNNPIITMY